MAIAFGRATANSAAGASPRAATVTVNAGETVVVHVTFDPTTCAVTGVTDNAAGSSSVYTKRGEETQGSSVKIETYSTSAGGAKAATSVSAAFSGTPTDVGIEAVCYTGVLGIGQYATGKGATGTATVSITTQDANNFVAFGAGWLNNTTLPTQGTGTIRLSDGDATIVQGFIDHTSASPGAVSPSFLAPSASPWAGGALELRSVAGGGQFVAPASKRPSKLRGPYDTKGFLLSPYRQYDYTSSVAVIPSIDGTGAMLVAAFVLAGTMSQTDAGTGSMAVAPPVHAGTTSQTESGTGSVAVSSPTFSGTVTQTITGTGSMAIPVFTFSGTSTQSETGTGSLAIPALQYAGTGSQAETGTGSLAIPPPVFSGTTSQADTGSGSLAIGSPVYSGTSSQADASTGSLAVASPQFSGTGDVTAAGETTGTGSLAVPAFAFSGTSDQTGTGSGDLALANPSFSGDGLAGAVGEGSLSVASPQFDGSGTTLDGTVTGSGDLSVTLSMSGVGSVPDDTAGHLSGGYFIRGKRKTTPWTVVAIERSEVEVVTEEGKRFVPLYSVTIDAQVTSPEMQGFGTVTAPKVAILDTVSPPIVRSEGGGSFPAPRREVRAPASAVDQPVESDAGPLVSVGVGGELDTETEQYDAPLPAIRGTPPSSTATGTLGIALLGMSGIGSVVFVKPLEESNDDIAIIAALYWASL